LITTSDLPVRVTVGSVAEANAEEVRSDEEPEIACDVGEWASHRLLATVQLRRVRGTRERRKKLRPARRADSIRRVGDACDTGTRARVGSDD